MAVPVCTVGVAVVAVVPDPGSVHTRISKALLELLQVVLREGDGLVDAGRERALPVDKGFDKHVGPLKTVGDIPVLRYRRLVQPDISRVGDRELTRFRTPGGDQNHTERTASTVDSGGGGVLQYRDGLDIVGIQHAGVSFDTIDQHKGTPSVDRGGSTDVDLR